MLELQFDLMDLVDVQCTYTSAECRIPCLVELHSKMVTQYVYLFVSVLFHQNIFHNIIIFL